MNSFYSGTDTVKQRIEQWMQECSEFGVPFRRAAIIAAVSVNETGAMFRAERSDMLLFPKECYPARPTMIIENGNPNLGTNLPQSWTNDPEIMEMLGTRGWLDTERVQLTSKVSFTDGPKTLNDALAFIFEWLIDRRKNQALQAFSIGPTQVYLNYSPLVAPAGPSTKVALRLPTWETLFKFYTARNAKEMIDTGVFDYLPTGVATYPKPGSIVCSSATSGNVCVESYLQNYQTGTRDWATPAMQRYAAGFLNAVQLTWAAARAIKYSADPQGDLGSVTA